MRGRIVIVEDEPLIAIDIEQAVVAAGCVVAGLAHTLAAAHDLFDKISCDGVILDANLGGESAEPIVDRLQKDNVPFVIVSGYTHEQLGFLDGSVPLVGKPFGFESLTASIRENILGEKP